MRAFSVDVSLSDDGEGYAISIDMNPALEKKDVRKLCEDILKLIDEAPTTVVETIVSDEE